MTKPLLYSIVEAPQHPNCATLYQRLGFDALGFDSQRKALAALKKQPPDYVVADFIYAFSTYYQATNISNLDVLLHSLVKYAPQARVIVLAAKDDLAHVEKLRVIHPLHAVLTYPVSEAQLEAALTP
jgi:DNA-binding NarL/FixJ family response regulator